MNRKLDKLTRKILIPCMLSGGIVFSQWNNHDNGFYMLKPHFFHPDHIEISSYHYFNLNSFSTRVTSGTTTTSTTTSTTTTAPP